MSDDCLPENEPVPERFQFSLRAMLIGVAVVALLLGLAVPAVRATLEAARQADCRQNLRQISFALRNYHDVWQCFPPARTLGPDGKAWHSWRVLLAPYLGAKTFYSQYRMDEPWNGPNNRKLRGPPFPFFRCPIAQNRDPCMTSYVAVVGPETAWPGTESVDRFDGADRLHDMIMVVEVADSGIHWMEPRDLEFDDLFPTGGGTAKVKPSSDHPGEFNVLFADGSVRWLPADVAREKLRAMLTRDGGEPVSLEAFSE